MNPWLLLLSFVLGIVVTCLWAIRTVRREVPAAALARIWDQPQVGARPASGRRRRPAQADESGELYDQELDEPADSH